MRNCRPKHFGCGRKGMRRNGSAYWPPCRGRFYDGERRRAGADGDLSPGRNLGERDAGATARPPAAGRAASGQQPLETERARLSTAVGGITARDRELTARGANLNNGAVPSLACKP